MGYDLPQGVMDKGIDRAELLADLNSFFFFLVTFEPSLNSSRMPCAVCAIFVTVHAHVVHETGEPWTAMINA